MAPDGESGRRRLVKASSIVDDKEETVKMVGRTKSAPLHDLSSSSSSLKSQSKRKMPDRSLSSTVPSSKPTPRFPKNTSRSLSPKPRFPSNPSRSRSQSPKRGAAKKERKETARKAATESLLDSASKLKAGPVESLLEQPSPDTTPKKSVTNAAVDKAPQSPTRKGSTKDALDDLDDVPQSPLVKANSEHIPKGVEKTPGSPLRASTGNYKTPMNDSTTSKDKGGAKPKSPLRKGRKDTVGGNRSTSKLPVISPLDADDNNSGDPPKKIRPKSPKSRKDTVGGNRSTSKLPTLNFDHDDKSAKSLDEDDTIISMPMEPNNKDTVDGNKSASKFPTLNLDDEDVANTKSVEETPALDHFSDIPPPELEGETSEALSPQSKPKDLPPSAAAKTPIPDLPTLQEVQEVGGDAFQTPNAIPASNRPKSPVRKGAKETVNGNQNNNSTSKFPQLSPLDGGKQEDDENDNTERKRNNSSSEVPDAFALDDWLDGSGEHDKSENAANKEKPVSDDGWDPFDTKSEDPFQATEASSEDPLNTTKPQQETKPISPIPPPPTAEKADANKRLPPKQRSRGARRSGGSNAQSSSAPLKRSISGDDLGSQHSKSRGPAPLRRANTFNGERRGEREQKPTKANDDHPGRKPSIAPRHNKPKPTEKAVTNAFRGIRAESILNHSLMGGSHSGMDLSESVVDVNASDMANPVPNHQRRRGAAEDRSSRGDASRSSIASQQSRGRRGSGSSRRDRASIPSPQNRSPEDKDRRRMRKSRSSPEGSLERPRKVDSPDQRRNARWTSRPREGEEKKSGENRRSRGSLERKGDKPSPERERRRGSASGRRARSRQRPEGEDKEAKTEKLSGGNDSIASLSQRVKSVNEENRGKSHSPARPRGRPGGASFPRNAARSVSPARGRGRAASPAPGSKHRRTVPPESSRARSASPSSSKHGRTVGQSSGSRPQRSVSPSRTGHGRPPRESSQRGTRSIPRESSQRGTRSIPRESSQRGTRSTPGSSRESSQRGSRTTSPNSSQQNLKGSPNSSQRELRKTRDDKELSPTPTPREQNPLAPPTGDHRHRPSLSLANVFDMERNTGGHESDSSQSDAAGTVLQFDPTNQDSVASFKPAPDDPSLNNSGTFKMEDLKAKEDLEDGSGDRSGSYLPGSMAVSSQQRAKSSSPQGEGRRRRASELRRQSSRSKGRSPRDAGGRRVRRERGDRPSIRKEQSLRIDVVFDKDVDEPSNSRSESYLDHDVRSRGSRRQHRDSISSHGSAASTDSRRGRRQRLRQKLREKDHQRQATSRDDDEESEEGASAYLPANMARPKSLSPPRSSTFNVNNDDDDNDASRELMTDTDDEDDEDASKRRSSALSYVKKQLKNQKNHIKNEVNVLKDKISSFREQQSQGSSAFNVESESEPDPYNKKPATKSESKSGGVGKKLKGLFQSKSNKKHAQLLGAGESDSDVSGVS